MIILILYYIEKTFYVIDHNLKSCRFDAVEKRLSTLMLVASLFGVINFGLITQSRLGSPINVDKYNSTMQYFASIDSDLTRVQKYSAESKSFLEQYGHDETAAAWTSPEDNWIAQIAADNMRRAVWTQSVFVGLIICLAAIYWGLSTVSAEPKFLTIWYRIIALPIYASTIVFVCTTYVLIQVCIDYVLCYSDGSAAVLAFNACVGLTYIITTVSGISIVGAATSNYHAI
jgi:hypothetical protein